MLQLFLKKGGVRVSVCGFLKSFAPKGGARHQFVNSKARLGWSSLIDHLHVTPCS